MKLEAKSVSVSIRSRELVSRASLHISGGELVGLIGPNGAGKSTLLRAILGITEKSAGDIMLDGKDFLALPGSERARAVAFLPQERRVEWRLPAHDIVMLGRYPHQTGFGGPTPEDRAAVDRALEAVDGNGLRDRPVAVLSGGERTRILLARALAVEAPLLLVDEPIAALDPYHQLHVMEILRERARNGCGVLAVIHDLALAERFMDRLVLMDSGRIVADAAPASVLTPERLATVYRIAGTPPRRLP
ncbi:MAG TPA: ABC transporter ATP-binding protein [Hyphomonadaceae bacterium]|nr:ABC transporter ATP-binding protein [Hyphomonadaceae bacterium]HPI48141.1 ABC transporter ATP-binding protein [Hyphomonadaceae bacterium]HPN06698.1 ABC transporter ATP-binding protein [Hyphomonadaceae bacterium]